MREEEAKILDEILENIFQSGFISQDLIENETPLVKLKMLEYIEYPRLNNGRYLANITNTGKIFLASGGFTKMAEDEAFDRRVKEKSIELAEDANKRSKKANIIAWIALALSAFVFLVGLFK